MRKLDPETALQRKKAKHAKKAAARKAKRAEVREDMFNAGTYRGPGRPAIPKEIKIPARRQRRIRDALRRERLTAEVKAAREALGAGNPTARSLFREKQEALLMANGWMARIVSYYRDHGRLPSDFAARRTIATYSTLGGKHYDPEFSSWINYAGGDADEFGSVAEWTPAEILAIRERSRAAYVARGGTIRDVGSRAIEETTKSDV